MSQKLPILIRPPQLLLISIHRTLWSVPLSHVLWNTSGNFSRTSLFRTRIWMFLILLKSFTFYTFVLASTRALCWTVYLSFWSCTRANVFGNLLRVIFLTQEQVWDSQHSHELHYGQFLNHSHCIFSWGSSCTLFPGGCGHPSLFSYPCCGCSQS